SPSVPTSPSVPHLAVQSRASLRTQSDIRGRAQSSFLWPVEPLLFPLFERKWAFFTQPLRNFPLTRHHCPHHFHSLLPTPLPQRNRLPHLPHLHHFRNHLLIHYPRHPPQRSPLPHFPHLHHSRHRPLTHYVHRAHPDFYLVRSQGDHQRQHPDHQ